MEIGQSCSPLGSCPGCGSKRAEAGWGFSKPRVHDSWLSTPDIRTCPALPQKEMDCKPGRPGRKAEACLGWLEKWRQNCGNVLSPPSRVGCARKTSVIEDRCPVIYARARESAGWKGNIDRGAKAHVDKAETNCFCLSAQRRAQDPVLMVDQVTELWSLDHWQDDRTGPGGSHTSWHSYKEVGILVSLVQPNASFISRQTRISARYIWYPELQWLHKSQSVSLPSLHLYQSILPHQSISHHCSLVFLRCPILPPYKRILSVFL